MKKYFLFYFLLIAGLNVKAQDNNLQQWENYLKSKTYEQYINFHTSHGGKNSKSLFYFSDQKNQKYIVVRENNILTRVIKYEGTDIFKMVKNNYSSIKWLKKKLNFPNTKRLKKDESDYQNESIEYINVGIKYKNLHYNHFRLKPDNESQKSSKAYQILTDIVNEMKKAALVK